MPNSGGDAGAVDRRAQQEAFDVLAQLVEELGACRLAVEAVEAGHPALGILGIEQVAGLDRAAALGDLAVEDHAEVVAFDLMSRLKSSLWANSLTTSAGHRRRGPGLGGALVEGAFHLALGDGGLVGDLLLQLVQLQRAVEGAREGQGRGRGGAHRQADQPGGPRVAAGLGDGGLEGHAGLDVDGVDRAGQRGDGLGGLRRGRRRRGTASSRVSPGQHLDGDALRAGEPGLGLGAGEGDMLQRRQARRDRVALTMEPRRFGRGQLPAQGQSGEAGDGDDEQRGARRKSDVADQIPASFPPSVTTPRYARNGTAGYMPPSNSSRWSDVRPEPLEAQALSTGFGLFVTGRVNGRAASATLWRANEKRPPVEGGRSSLYATLARF
jgi:hypothetical protein